jgi:dsRNA-specific ribonuclease
VGLFNFLFKRSSAAPAYKKQLRNVLGFTPGTISLYKTALTHRSVGMVQRKIMKDWNTSAMPYSAA